jgi:formate-dependent nitrite reductase membrane component NrfD
LLEITITGANVLTSPVLYIWNWGVSVYLFLVATAAGLLVMSTLAVFRGRTPSPGQRKDILTAACFVPVLLFLGMLTIWLELEAKQNSFWLFLSFSYTSPMFWGGWGLILTFIISMLYGLSLMTDDAGAKLKFNFLKVVSLRLASHTSTLAGMCCFLGILMGLYTGVPLSLFVARPLWNSAVAPIVFLVSSMTTGAALFVILSCKKPTQLFFTKALIWLIGAEVVTIFLFFVGQLMSSPAKREAVLPFFSLNQDYFPVVVSFILIGICIPLVLVLNLLRVNEAHSEGLSRTALLRMKLGACLILAGGFILRFGWVYLGQLSRLS